MMIGKQLLVAMVFAAALLFASQTANSQTISKYGFSSDAEGKDVKLIVDPGTKLIYCFASYAHPMPEKTFKFVWTFTDLDTQQRTEVFSQEVKNPAGTTISSKYAPVGGLKHGTYTVNLWIDGQNRKTARLIVQPPRT
jgi:hypothetical protein